MRSVEKERFADHGKERADSGSNWGRGTDTERIKMQASLIYKVEVRGLIQPSV